MRPHYKKKSSNAAVARSYLNSVEVRRCPHRLQSVEVLLQPGEDGVPALHQLDASLIGHQLKLPPLPVFPYLRANRKASTEWG